MSLVFSDVKKVVGIPDDDHSFDTDLEIYMNAALANLAQVGGVNRHGGLIEAQDPATWEDITRDYADKRDVTRQVKAYVCLYVRLMFDPPATSFVINAMEKQLDEMIWRIREASEGEIV